MPQSVSSSQSALLVLVIVSSSQFVLHKLFLTPLPYLSPFLSFPLLLSLISFPSSFLERRELSRAFLIVITSTVISSAANGMNLHRAARKLRLSSLSTAVVAQTPSSRKNIASTFSLVKLGFGLHHLASGILGEWGDEF